MDSDLILVLDAGEVAEFGPPKQLLEAGGAFASIYAAAAGAGGAVSV